MKFKVDSDYLKSALIQASRVASKKSTIPVLESVRLSAADNRVTVDCTDLQLSMVTSFEAEVGEPGVTIVSNARLLGLIRALGKGDVTVTAWDLEGVDAKAAVTMNGTTVSMKAYPAGDYPTLPTELNNTPETKRVVAFPFGTFTEALDTCADTLTKEETRFQLNAILLELEPGSRKAALVSTDGHRMTIASMESTTKQKGHMQGLLHARLVNAIIHAPGGDDDGNILIALPPVTKVDDTRVKDGDGYVVVYCGNTRFASRAMNVNYPKYREVVMQLLATDSVAVFERAAMLKAVKLTSLVGMKRRALRLVIKAGSVEIALDNTNDTGMSIVQHVPAETQAHGARVFLSVEYLLRNMKAMAGTHVRLHLRDANSQAIIEPVQDDDDPVRYQVVVMPMRVEDEGWVLPKTK
jgi:DNA polymerase III subunit beta